VHQNRLVKYRGHAALVGAGPGNPGLLTLRGRELLELADVVLFDSLISQKLRVYAQKAQWVNVGKRAGEPSMSQDQINAMLIRHAAAGKRVVRLKGGDPCIFGRGGEEALALAEAKVAFEIVPGVTAATAAGAYAGIPLTHRNHNSSVTFIAGHSTEGRDFAADNDWAAIAKLPCVAFYMGVKSLSMIALKLIEHGLPPDTPAACIQWATLPEQKTVTATIATLADAVLESRIATPALTLVGSVVALREQLRWFDNRPLSGKTIMVTRTRVQASVLSARLEALGARGLGAPPIEIAPLTDWSEVDGILGELARGISKRAPAVADWIIFTSPNAASAVRDRLWRLGLDARIFAGAKIAVVGESTRAAVEKQLCCRADLCPEQFFLEALADALHAADAVAGRKFLLLRADIARPVLLERLRSGGASDVRDVAVYMTRKTAALPDEVWSALRSREVDWITFTSSSTANNLAALLGPDAIALLGTTKLASIGPVTSTAIRALGFEPRVEASPHDLDGLVTAIEACECQSEKAIPETL